MILSQDWEAQFRCWVCGEPTVIYFIKYLPNRDMTVLKIRCPRHGERAVKIPTMYKNEWLPYVQQHVKLCYKCGAPVSFYKSRVSGAWRQVRLSCPTHREKIPIYQFTSSIYMELGIEGPARTPTPPPQQAYRPPATYTPAPPPVTQPAPAAAPAPASVAPPAAIQPIPEKKLDVSVKRQFEHIGGLLRIKAKVSNETSNVITEAQLRFDIPLKPFHLMKIEPEYKTEGTTVFIPVIQPNTSKSVSYMLEPLVCGKDKIYGNLQYLDASGQPQIVQINPLEVNVVCPLFFTEEEANVAKLNNLLQTRLNVRDERSYIIPDNLASNRAYSIVKSVISKHDVKLVFEDVHEEVGSYRADSWWFGKTKVTKSDFIITGNVNEENRSMKVVVACEREEQLTGLLSEMGKVLRETTMGEAGLGSESELKSLRCPTCAGPLETSPLAGKVTFCPHCQQKIALQDLEA